MLPGAQLGRTDHRGFRPAGWIEAGRQKLERMRPIAERHGLTMLSSRASGTWLRRPVACVAPTLIQEAGPDAKPVEAKRAELAETPPETLLSSDDVAAIRGDRGQPGSMTLKGAAAITRARRRRIAGRSPPTWSESESAGRSTLGGTFSRPEGGYAGGMFWLSANTFSGRTRP